MKGLKTPIVVVSHDAGGANFLSGIVAAEDQREIRLVVDGPARVIFERLFPGRFTIWSLENAMNGAGSLLTGTSVASALEHSARRMAAQKKIPSIAVLDHWVHYRERFVRDDETVLPDKIWVGDSYAFKQASLDFPALEVVQFSNRYLENEVSQIGPLPKRTPGGPLRVLYVLEPIRIPWGVSGVAGEFQALEYFSDRLSLTFPGEFLDICLRPHPSESPSKYSQWAESRRELGFRIDSERALTELMSDSSVVVGCESYAMVIALLSGRRVMTTIPPWGYRCRLPHDGIETLP